MGSTVTVNELLDGYVCLDIECLDRIYLNGYVPNLQVGGQVVSFMTQHLGLLIPSPAIMDEFLPGLADHPTIAFALAMPFESVVGLAAAEASPELLVRLRERLNALPG